MKRALVLSGGGAKGAFQVGALKTLVLEKMLWFDAMFGVSTGSLTTATLAQAKTPLELVTQLAMVESRYLAITSRKDYFLGDFNLHGIIDLLERGGILDSAPLAKKIEEAIDPKLLAASPIHWECGICDMISGFFVSISNKHENQIHQAVLASCMEPLIMILPFEWVDGGVRNITPLSRVFDFIYEDTTNNPANEDDPDWEIYVVMASPVDIEPLDYFNRKNLLQVASRLTDILLNEVYVNDILTALKINQKVTEGDDDEHMNVTMHFIVPHKPMGDALDFNMVKIRDDILYGEAMAMAPMSEDDMYAHIQRARGHRP